MSAIGNIAAGAQVAAPYAAAGYAQGQLAGRQQQIALQESAADRGVRLAALQTHLLAQQRGFANQGFQALARVYADPALAQLYSTTYPVGPDGKQAGPSALDRLGQTMQKLFQIGQGQAHADILGPEDLFWEQHTSTTLGRRAAGDTPEAAVTAGGLPPGYRVAAPAATPTAPTAPAAPGYLPGQPGGNFQSETATPTTAAPATPPAPAAPPAAPPSLRGVPAAPVFGPLLPTDPGLPTQHDLNDLLQDHVPVGIAFPPAAPAPGAVAPPATPPPVAVNGQTLPPGTRQVAVAPGADPALQQLAHDIAVTGKTAIDQSRTLNANPTLPHVPATLLAGVAQAYGTAANQATIARAAEQGAPLTPNEQRARIARDTAAADEANANAHSIRTLLPASLQRLENEADQLDAQAAYIRGQTGLAPRETAAREKQANAAALGAQARRVEAAVLRQDFNYRTQVLPGVQNDLAGLQDARAHLFMSRADRERDGWGTNIGGGAFPYHGSVGWHTAGGQSQQDYWVNVPAAKRLLSSPSAADRKQGWAALVGALRAQERGKGDIHTPGAGTEYLNGAAFPGARLILDGGQYQALKASGPLGTPQHNAVAEKLKLGYQLLNSTDYSTPPAGPSNPTQDLEKPYGSQFSPDDNSNSQP